VQLIQKILEVDQQDWTNGGAIIRIIAIIDGADVVEHIFTHLTL
jgi:hypothetical protein